MPQDLTEAETAKLPLPVRILRQLDPGLVTGAADDDPSGVATYSQIGAQFGYGIASTIPFSFPMLAAIQSISTWIDSVTGRGIAQNLMLISTNRRIMGRLTLPT